MQKSQKTFSIMFALSHTKLKFLVNTRKLRTEKLLITFETASKFARNEHEKSSSKHLTFHESNVKFKSAKLYIINCIIAKFN